MKKEWLVKAIAVVIVVLFLGTGFTYAFSADNNSKPENKGNWLYVGGSGEGNYTKIQDAIENATNGDTVFVYDDSSPYTENIEHWKIIINKSINLIGENWYSTIIKNGSIRIISDNVTISGFTLQNFIYDNIYSNSDNIIISHNRIINDQDMGIESYGSNVKIFSNEFLISRDTTLQIWNGDNIEIYRNNFTECNDLFDLSLTTRTRVYENNFLSRKNAFVYWDAELLVVISSLRIKFYQNYWYQLRLLPKPIFGLTFIYVGHYENQLIYMPIPWILFDHNPAKKPYDIGA